MLISLYNIAVLIIICRFLINVVVKIRPFFCAALATEWKVQFRHGFAYFNNNVDSKTTYNYKNCYIIYMYIYIYIYGEKNIVLV